MSIQANDSIRSIDSIRKRLSEDIGGLVVAAQRVYRLRAIALWSAANLAILLAIVCVDMFVRREELGLRVLAFGLWLGSAAAAAFYWIAPAWKFAPSKFELARWIERAQPELGERLSTAVELADASPSDNRLGSLQFRDAALRGWSDFASRVSWKSYLDYSNLLRAGGLLGLALIAALGIAVWRPADVRLAVARLLAPWSALPWPLQDQLQFVDLPQVIALGQELNLEIIDLQAPLPEAIELLVRYPDSDAPEEVLRIPTKNLIDVAVASVPSVDQAIEIRAIGGDDLNMDWYRVEVAQPPKLESFRFKIQPPQYSGRPISEIVGNRLQVLSGSRVQFVGRLAEPVQNVEIAVQSRPNSSSAPAAGDAELVAVELSPSGRDFEWRACDASSPRGVLTWRWKVTAKTGLTVESPEIWSIEILPDAVPIVAFAEQELSQLSPDAALRIRGAAADDLGLEQVSLRWQVESTDAVEPGEVSLWSKADADNLDRREYAIDRTWQLDSSLGLLAGQRLNLWLEARDTLGQIGKSSPQAMEVRDAADVLESIAVRQSQLLEQVRGLTEAQRRNSQLAARSREIVEQSQTVRREEVDALVNVAQMQQSVNRQLSADRSSVAESLRTLKQLLENNQLSETEMAQQVNLLSERIESASGRELKRALDDAQRAFEQAKEAAAGSAQPSKALTDALAASESSQSEALTQLQGLTDRLAQSEALRVIERELGQVLNQQQSLRRDTDNLELRRLAGMNQEDFQASRAGLQADQQGLAQTLDQMQKRAKTLVDALPADQAALKSQVGQAIDRLTKDQVSGQMRAATESISSDRFVEAAETQATVVESLRNALQKLSASSSRNLEGQLGQLRTTAAELRDLAGAQSELASKLAAADGQLQAAALSEEQTRLQLRTEDQQTRSGQVGDSQTEQALERAAESQASAAESAKRGEAEAAAKQAREAADQLAAAARNSAQRAQELESELAAQQLLQMVAALSQLVGQQHPIVEKLAEAALVQVELLEGEARKSAEQGIRQLASRQEAVRQMVRDVRVRADKLPAFEWTLEQVELDMARAVAASQRFRIAPDATTSATRALRKLEQAASALKRPDQAPLDQQNLEKAEPETSDEQDSKTRPVPPLASLKLLRGLQADVNEETRQLSDASTISGSDRTQRIEQLSQQQQALGLQLEQILLQLEAARDSKP